MSHGGSLDSQVLVSAHDARSSDSHCVVPRTGFVKEDKSWDRNTWAFVSDGFAIVMSGAPLYRNTMGIRK